MTDYLYVMDRGDARKVGFSKDPDKRSVQVAKELGAQVCVLYVLPVQSGRDCERAAHEALKRFRQDGEWFKVDAEAAIQAVLWAAENPQDPCVKRPRPFRLSDDVRDRFEAAQKASGLTAERFIVHCLDALDAQGQNQPSNQELLEMLRQRLKG